MKQRRFDYKVKKGSQQKYRPVKPTKKGPSSSSNKGLLVIVIAFIFFLLLSWYILSKINTPTPTTESNIPPVSHFLLINDNSRGNNKSLHSVVMATLHRDSESIFLSYFPEKLSLNNQETLNYYYKNDGALGVMRQFGSIVSNEIVYFCVIKKELYSKIFPDLNEVKLWKDSQANLIVENNILKADEDDGQLFNISGLDILKYLQYNKETRTTADIVGKKNRMLYVVDKILSGNQRNVQRLVGAYHSDFLDHNFSIADGREYQHYFNSAKKLMVLNLPLEYKAEQNKFKLKLSQGRYKSAIKEVDERSNRKLGLNAKDYLRVVRKIDPAVESSIEVKIIDRSNRGDQSQIPTFLQYYRKFFRVDSYILQTDYFVDKSYIVNVKHKMELVNYARMALNIQDYYNSAKPKEEEYDLIIVLGKDAIEFVPEEN